MERKSSYEYREIINDLVKNNQSFKVLNFADQVDFNNFKDAVYS